MNKRTLFVTSLLILLTCSVFGENVDFELGKFGFHTTAGALISYESLDQPALWLGGTLHLSPVMALRPELLVFASHRNDDDNISGTGSDRRTRAFGGGIDLFFYFPVNTVYFYLGPGIRLFHRNVERDNTDGSGYHEDDFTISAGATTGGLFMLSKQFGFFGEISLGVDWYISNDRDWNTLGVTTSDDKARVTQFLIQRASLGAVFYLN